MSRTAEVLLPTPTRRARGPPPRTARAARPAQSRARVPAQSRGTLDVEREILYCGSIQPLTSQQLIEPHQPLDPLSASLAAQNQSEPRQQMLLQSSGCGAQVHVGAVSEFRLWSGDTTGVARTVIALDERYVNTQSGAMLDSPGHEGCGCGSQYVGCAICGNHLGALFTPCATHTSPSYALPAVYTFLPSAVSPPIPTSGTSNTTDTNAPNQNDPNPTGNSNPPLGGRLPPSLYRRAEPGSASALPATHQQRMYARPAWADRLAREREPLQQRRTDAEIYAQHLRSAAAERSLINNALALPSRADEVIVNNPPAASDVDWDTADFMAELQRAEAEFLPELANTRARADAARESTTAAPRATDAARYAQRARSFLVERDALAERDPALRVWTNGVRDRSNNSVAPTTGTGTGEASRDTQLASLLALERAWAAEADAHAAGVAGAEARLVAADRRLAEADANVGALQRRVEMAEERVRVRAEARGVQRATGAGPAAGVLGAGVATAGRDDGATTRALRVGRRTGGARRDAEGEGADGAAR
ncbi:hypothetical protein C8R47DRAFT_1328035 [Mycena vitilis]|nr:hypothetical protein C8R47DRAFT_1328035 [Mycena vitilis]